jgi:hypothetical protein
MKENRETERNGERQGQRQRRKLKQRTEKCKKEGKVALERGMKRRDETP